MTTSAAVTRLEATLSLLAPGEGSVAEARHGVRVAVVAGSIAESLGLTFGRCQQIVLAALLHDLGKLMVPRAVRDKAGPLTEAEWALMRTHPAESERLATKVTSDAEILQAIRSHHERWDGAGYPDGLAGERIPVGARVLAVADAFAAMTEKRAYRAPLPFEVAWRELRRGGGCQFEAAVVAAFDAAAAAIRPSLESDVELPAAPASALIA